MAYADRGLAKSAKGDTDGAVADYTKAIEIKPDFADAYARRGNLKKEKGDLNGALADINKAIQVDPKFSWAYHYRGCLRYDQRAFADAMADFRKLLSLDPSRDYARFRVWLIRARQGEAAAATTELQTYLAGRPAAKPNDWTQEIGRFLAGQVSEHDFLSAANAGEHKTKEGHLCEAYFYAGSKQLFAGNKTLAAEYFQKSVATGASGYLEYASAAAELKSLQAR
jgi:lipoprotein NlpI